MFQSAIIFFKGLKNSDASGFESNKITSGGEGLQQECAVCTFLEIIRWLGMSILDWVASGQLVKLLNVHHK